MTSVLNKKRKVKRDLGHTEEKAREARGGDWNDVATSKKCLEMPEPPKKG